jgi:hypothetical protein
MNVVHVYSRLTETAVTDTEQQGSLSRRARRRSAVAAVVIQLFMPVGRPALGREVEDVLERLEGDTWIVAAPACVAESQGRWRVSWLGTV